MFRDVVRLDRVLRHFQFKLKPIVRREESRQEMIYRLISVMVTPFLVTEQFNPSGTKKIILFYYKSFYPFLHSYCLVIQSQTGKSVIDVLLVFQK